MEKKRNKRNAIKPEEEDLEGKEGDNGQASVFEASFQVANCIAGAGILALPVSIRYMGLILGSLFIAFIAGVSYYSADLLLRCESITKKAGFGLYSKILYGAKGSFIVKLVVILNNFGLCAAYYKIFGQISANLASIFIHDQTSFFVDNWHNFFYILLLALLLFSLIMKDDIESLTHTSIIAVGGIIFFFLGLVTVFIFKLYHGLLPEFTSSFLWPSGSPMEILSILPSVFLAFTFQFNIFPIYFSLKDRNHAKMKQATWLGITYCMVLYITIGILGFLLYGYSLHNTILDSMKVDIQVYKDYSTFLLYVLVVMNMAVLCLSTMSIPLMFLSLKTNTINMVIFLRKRYLKYLEKANFNLAEAMKEEQKDVREVKKAKVLEKQTKTYISILLYIGMVTVTIIVTYLKTIFNVVGSTAGNAISFILPNLFFIKLSETHWTSGSYIFSKFLYMFGVVLLIVCLTAEVFKEFHLADS